MFFKFLKRTNLKFLIFLNVRLLLSEIYSLVVKIPKSFDD